MSDEQTQITPEEFRALQKQLGQITKQMAALSSENANLKAKVGEQVEILPPGEAPIYELAVPYFSPDDVWYPEGAQIEDITGRIVPNESMIPMNAAAEKRMRDWQIKQPSKDRMPPLELIVQAAVEMRPKEGDAVLPHGEFMKAVMTAAIARHYDNLGLPADEARRLPVRPARHDPNVPIMSNTRINNHSGPMAPRATREYRPATAAADKAAPPIGTAQTSNIGRHANPGAGAR